MCEVLKNLLLFLADHLHSTLDTFFIAAETRRHPPDKFHRRLLFAGYDIVSAQPAKVFDIEDKTEWTESFKDPEPVTGMNRYYLRVEQTDGNMAWASPVWVTYKL